MHLRFVGNLYSHGFLGREVLDGDSVLRRICRDYGSCNVAERTRDNFLRLDLGTILVLIAARAQLIAGLDLVKRARLRVVEADGVG